MSYDSQHCHSKVKNVIRQANILCKVPFESEQCHAKPNSATRAKSNTKVPRNKQTRGRKLLCDISACLAQQASRRTASKQDGDACKPNKSSLILTNGWGWEGVEGIEVGEGNYGVGGGEDWE